MGMLLVKAEEDWRNQAYAALGEIQEHLDEGANPLLHAIVSRFPEPAGRLIEALVALDCDVDEGLQRQAGLRPTEEILA